MTDHVAAGLAAELVRAVPGPSRPDVAIFDLDRTLIAGSSLVHLGRELVRRRMISRSHVARHSFAQASFRRRGLSDDAVGRIVARLLMAVTGIEAEPMRSVARDVGEDVAGRITSTARWLVQHHRAEGDLCILVSASPEPLVESVAATLGFQHAIGTRLEVREGRCTGRLDGPFCYGPNKVAALHRYLGSTDLSRATAYADSMSDLPLLEQCGAAVAVNPDPGLRRVARQRSWPIVRCA